MKATKGRLRLCACLTGCLLVFRDSCAHFEDIIHIAVTVVSVDAEVDKARHKHRDYNLHQNLAHNKQGRKNRGLNVTLCAFQ